MNSDKGTGRISIYQWLILFACLALFVGLRIPWIGHLLSVDEASNLLAFRAYASGGSDYYSSWFWRHPPALSLVLLQLSPLADGFAERAELAVIVLNALAFVALFVVNSRLLGIAPALWACFFLAVMPGAVFFDVWIKQESLVTLFGLLSLYLFLRARIPWSGLLLGLALLSKAVAIFYAAALFSLWLFQGPDRRRLRDLLTVAAIAVGVSAWWYILFAGSSTRSHLGFMAGSEDAGMTEWIRPWYYFFEKLPVDLGWGGIALFLLGVGASCAWFWNLPVSRRVSRPAERIAVLWPLAFLVPAYIVLSVIRGKTPWLTMSVYPAFATLQGIGAWWMISSLNAMLCSGQDVTGATRSSLRRGLVVAISVVFVGGALLGVADRNYENVMTRQYYWMWWGAANSRDAALSLNRLVKDGEQVMITPMYYWAQAKPRPCPIFVWYLKPMSVVVRRLDTPLDEIVRAIREYQLDWIMISLRPGIGEKNVIQPIMRQYGLNPLLLRGACIFKTDSIYKRDVNPPSESSP